MADELVQKVKPVLTEVQEIIHYVNDPEGDLKKTIRNAEQLTRRLEETRQNSDRLLVTAAGNVDRVATRANSLLDSARTKIEGIDVNPTLTRINSTIDHLDGRLPSLLEKADASLENVRRISLETRLLSEKAFPKIPGVISQAEDVMFSTDRLLNSLQNTWLLRDQGVPSGKQGFIPGDSHE
jgi:phospholipid/cholesterol/gamma-HCH transport system substrate-binding protein